MNERDLRLAKELSDRIETGDGPSTFIFTARYTNLVRTNLVVLKVFLDEKRNRGLMVTIDRPHQYISHLLQLHGIDPSGLEFIDAISGHSSDTKDGTPSPSFKSGPFRIEELPEFIVADRSGEDGVTVGLKQAQFILLDNISTLLTYNSMENVKEFFERYKSALRESGASSVTTLIVMDRNLHAELFSFLSGHADRIVEITQDMELGALLSGGRNPPGPSGDARSGVVTTGSERSAGGGSDSGV